MLVELRHVSKIYSSGASSVTALDNVSLEIEAGDFIAVIGKSGCGKSTLLNLCGTMDFPSTGTVAIDGQITTSLRDAELARLRREKIGFVFQSFQLLHTLTAAENVELPLLLGRQSGVRKAALERLRWVGLEEEAARYPHQLSGGQQQRVAIARALVHNPRLLIADEPTGNLDTATGEIVLKLLARTASEFGVAVITATHSVEGAALADRIVHLRDGRVVEALALP
ncbi:MAG TPA: ABC transporter ATP-binding protein [Bryobacteraceae bacterium]